MQDKVTTHESVNKALEDIAKPSETRTPTAPPPPPPANDEPPAAEPTKPAAPAFDADYIDAATDTAFAILDGVQETCFTIAANIKKKNRAKKITGENGITRLMELKAERQAAKKASVEIVQEYTGNDAKLIALDTAVEEFIKDLPFTEKQIKMMRPGLRIMVERNAGNIPPELLFFAGLATAIGGNIAELYSI